jgi:hypothetical protein
MADTTQFVSGTFSNADVDSSEDVLILGVRGHQTLWLTFLVGTANLTAFTVEYQANEGGDWALVASAGAKYTTPTQPVNIASGDLNTAAFGSTVHYLSLNVLGVSHVRIKAAGTSSTITGHYGMV